MITFLLLSTHKSLPRNVIYSHFFGKKRYQLAGSVITILCREIVRPLTYIRCVASHENNCLLFEANGNSLGCTLPAYQLCNGNTVLMRVLGPSK